jgi:hypothetical protein
MAFMLPLLAFGSQETLLPLDETAADPRQTFTLFGFTFKLKHQEEYNIERIALGICIFLVVKMVIGRNTNKNLAIAYVAELDRDAGILKKQFAEAEPTVIVDGPETFKFHATGRRYCQGALFTFRLKSRQYPLAGFTTFFGGNQRDFLEIEVNMNESAMPSSVLFIGTHTAAKTVAKENRDIVELTKRMEPTRDRLPTWPGLLDHNNSTPNNSSEVVSSHTASLVVQAEHPSAFYEIMTPAVVDVLFGGQDGGISRYFRYLHASSDFQSPVFLSADSNVAGATGKRSVVRCAFTLPPSGNWETIDKFVLFVCLVIDGLGSCKLTQEQVKKAADLRRTVEAKRESTVYEKEKKLEERRAQKEAEERARLAKLTPEQREKERAKRDKILRQRKMKSMVKRM